MPSPLNHLHVLLDDASKFAQGPRIEAHAESHSYLGPEPEFRLAVGLPHMHMSRLARVSFVRVEEEAEALVAQHDRHRRIIGGQITNALFEVGGQYRRSM